MRGVPAEVELVTLPRNRGFGPGANAGFRHILANPRPDDRDWIGLAPHDAEPAPDCLARILAAVGERPHAGLACADFGDGATPIVDPYFGGILGPATVTEGWEPAGHPHGTLMLAHRRVLEEVGLFDERYFAYCEEADLALRALAAGWETGLVRGAMVVNPDLGTRISGDRLPPAAQHAAPRAGALGPLPRHHPVPPRGRSAGQRARVTVAARALLGSAGACASARSTTPEVATARRRPSSSTPPARPRRTERPRQRWPSSAASISWRTVVRYQLDTHDAAEHGEAPRT